MAIWEPSRSRRLGWFTYFTNRTARRSPVHRPRDAARIVGGGAVTALFGDAKTTLFGAYGLGLAVGFFAYFLTLIVLVRRSKGVFTMAWFLDGRRRRSGTTRRSGDSRAARGDVDAATAAAQPARHRRRRACRSLRRSRSATAHHVMLEVLRDLARRTAEEADPDQRRRCRSRMLVSQKLVELVARGSTAADAERAMAGSSRPSQE